jgi:hypothetical protein
MAGRRSLHTDNLLLIAATTSRASPKNTSFSNQH